MVDLVTTTYLASARKSYGAYKPVIVHIHSTGGTSTEIVGQRGYREHIIPLTKWYDGPTDVYHAQRGITFATRTEAVTYAQSVIDLRRAHDEKRATARKQPHQTGI